MVRGGDGAIQQPHSVYVRIAVCPSDSLAGIGYAESHARDAVVSRTSSTERSSNIRRQSATRNLQDGLHTAIARSVGGKAQLTIKELVSARSKCSGSRGWRPIIWGVDHDVVHLAGCEEAFVLHPDGEVRCCFGGAQSNVGKNVAILRD